MAPQKTLLVALDLGTSSATANHCMVQDRFDPSGTLIREKYDKVLVKEVMDWPGGSKSHATGNVCVPTTLVVEKASRQLLFWGFEAQQYLDDPIPEISSDRVVVIEHIKLLLPNPDDAKTPTNATTRYKAKTEELMNELGKTPFEVFEMFMDRVVEHVVGDANRRFSSTIHNSTFELILAFPGGWPEHVHTRVAEIGAMSMSSAIKKHRLQGITFGTEYVYTVSETICGVREWLGNAIAYAAIPSEGDQQGINLDELEVGDSFIGTDIGGGTGCVTPLRLVSKYPLQVDQLGPTQSLEVSGEAVEAEFEKWIRTRITRRDYPGDLERLIRQICRKFREDKKDCGVPSLYGSSTWNFSAPRLRANPRKGFVQDFAKIDRYHLDQCFDPCIDLLEAGLEQMLQTFPGIKVVVFLGQFGSTSEYLKRRMAASTISERVKIRYSESGKLNVVKGAMSGRLNLAEVFVRRYESLRSYGTLVSMLYYPGSEAQRMFPNARSEGAHFEKEQIWERVKVIEWAIPIRTPLENGTTQNVGKDTRRYHEWAWSEDDIWFEDTIVVSDETPPPSQINGTSYTLWTLAHEQNRLFIDNKRIQVQQIPFSWDLSMSRKLDADGNVVGPYTVKEVGEEVYVTRKRAKGKKRDKFRRLHYDPVWNITEMQVKLSVKALIHNSIGGQPTTQLAHQLSLTKDDMAVKGESRSKALEKDIEISRSAGKQETEKEARENREESMLLDVFGPAGTGLVNSLRDQYQEDQREDQQETSDRSPTINSLPDLGWENVKSSVAGPSRTTNTIHRSPASKSPANLHDGRRREGCFTCKDRKKKCDLSFVKGPNGHSTCTTCLRYGIPCHIKKPDWARDPQQAEAQKRDRTLAIKLGKRKARDESESSSSGRARSTTLQPSGFLVNQVNHTELYQSVEGSEGRVLGESSSMGRGKWTAVRGGKHGSKHHHFKH